MNKIKFLILLISISISNPANSQEKMHKSPAFKMRKDFNYAENISGELKKQDVKYWITFDSAYIYFTLETSNDKIKSAIISNGFSINIDTNRRPDIDNNIVFLNTQSKVQDNSNQEISFDKAIWRGFDFNLNQNPNSILKATYKVDNYGIMKCCAFIPFNAIIKSSLENSSDLFILVDVLSTNMSENQSRQDMPEPPARGNGDFKKPPQGGNRQGPPPGGKGDGPKKPDSVLSLRLITILNDNKY